MQINRRSVSLTVPKFWFVCLFYTFSKRQDAVLLKYKRRGRKVNKSELTDCLSTKSLPYFFEKIFKILKNQPQMSSDLNDLKPKINGRYES